MKSRAKPKEYRLTSIIYAGKPQKPFFNYTKKKNKGISIDIKKKIPHAAGLAGGSADGAAVILALDKIYKTALADKELCEIGVKIGADLPFLPYWRNTSCSGNR